ncbi:MAG TPA: hypothetical protein VFV12_08790 [Xanthobacteraceae bacterium]|nr:hypothetical protein [Xanthobacteraceae bacterium]
MSVFRSIAVGELAILSAQDGLIAHAGGGQALALDLTPFQINRFTTVTTPGDSARLVAVTAGLLIVVINDGANVLNVFPDFGDQIAKLGVNNPYAVPAGSAVLFVTPSNVAQGSGNWRPIQFAPGLADQVYNNLVTAASFTATGANITGGADEVTVDLTGAIGAGSNFTLPTVAQLVAAMTAAGINPTPGFTYELDIINRNGGANAWTVVTNTGWTLNGTMTIASGTYRRFYVTLTSLTAATLQSIGTVTIGAA